MFHLDCSLLYCDTFCILILWSGKVMNWQPRKRSKGTEVAGVGGGSQVCKGGVRTRTPNPWHQTLSTSHMQEGQCIWFRSSRVTCSPCLHRKDWDTTQKKERKHYKNRRRWWGQLKMSKVRAYRPRFQNHLCSQGTVWPWITIPFMSLHFGFLICNKGAGCSRSSWIVTHLPCYWECQLARSFCTEIW